MVRNEFRQIVLTAILFVVIFFLLSFTTGCSTLETTQAVENNQTYYAHDLQMTVNGQVCLGVCKVYQATEYTIRIQAPADIDQLVISSCSRTDVPIPDSLGSRRKGYTYVYTPNLIEEEIGCNLSINGYIKDLGKSTSGLITFDRPGRFTLTAGVSCNGQTSYVATGSAICQAMRGQLMAVWFTEPTRLAPRKIKKKEIVPTETSDDLRCQIERSPELKMWKLSVGSAECNYVFETVNLPYRQFLLTTVGAQELHIRKE